MTRSPRRLSKQVREAVGEHVRDLPVQAARFAMFGVGRALLLSDRVTRDYRELRGSGPRPVLNRLREDVQHLAGKAVTRVTERTAGPEAPASAARETPDITVARPPATAGTAPVGEPEIAVGKPTSTAPGGTAETAPRPKTAPEAAARARTVPSPAAPKPVTAPESVTAPEPPARPEPLAEPAPEPGTAPKTTPKSKIAAESLPVPDYDQATLPSLRGRLRSLSAEQIRLLRAYERENAARADVLRMYENRIAKLDQG